MSEEKDGEQNNTNSCKVMNISGKVVDVSCTAQNMELVIAKTPGVGQAPKSFTMFIQNYYFYHRLGHSGTLWHDQRGTQGCVTTGVRNP